jgi:hypothetical protein
MSETTDLKRTPLFEIHLASKAKMVDFGGWHMPVQYSSIIEEHTAAAPPSASSTSATWAKSKSAARKPSTSSIT